jgi:hypothetical protein
MDNPGNLPELGRYLRLYGLHLVEHSVSYEVVLRVRVAASRYITSHLPTHLNEHWSVNPHEGVSLAREAIQAQLNTLKQGLETAWSLLGLNQESDPLDRFQAQRQQLGREFVPTLATGAGRSLVPVNRAAALMLPNNRILSSLHTVQKLLEVTHTALLVADTARQLWYGWRTNQAEYKILQARRLLLEDAVRAAEISQDHALQKALDPQFVENYLLTRGDDEAYDILFGEVDNPPG